MDGEFHTYAALKEAELLIFLLVCIWKSSRGPERPWRIRKQLLYALVMQVVPTSLVFKWDSFFMTKCCFFCTVPLPLWFTTSDVVSRVFVLSLSSLLSLLVACLCQLKQAGTMCRGPAGACDLPEYCTGASPYCPANVYLLDGTSCQYGLAYCYNGMCLTHEQQCLQLWGYGNEKSIITQRRQYTLPIQSILKGCACPRTSVSLCLNTLNWGVYQQRFSFILTVTLFKSLWANWFDSSHAVVCSEWINTMNNMSQD